MVATIEILNGEVRHTITDDMYNNLYIRYNGEEVGIMAYNLYKDSLKILFINIKEEYRRKGIAKRVIETIIELYGDRYIYGDAIPDAIKFWESINVEFDEEIEDDRLIAFHL